MQRKTVITEMPVSAVWLHQFAAGIVVMLGKLRIVLVWVERSNERYRLKQLSDRALRDFGCNRCDAHREYDKYFWQP